MKKISKLVGLTLAALAIMLTGCRKSTGSSTPIEKEEIPADAMRNLQMILKNLIGVFTVLKTLKSFQKLLMVEIILKE